MARGERSGDDEMDLINAEFESMVSGLNLDQSSPRTYLDDLDELEKEEVDELHRQNRTKDQLKNPATGFIQAINRWWNRKNNHDDDGSGGIARRFSEDLARLDGHVVAAVGSRSKESAEKFAADFPGCASYSSYEDLVEADVDAIYVATPHPMHHANTLLAMKAGKPVLCEKAFTVNASQARELIDYSRTHKIALMEAMWTRFLPHIDAIKKLIADGVLGEIHTVVADHGQYIPYTRAARLWEPELGGGALLDLGIYPLTIAHIVLGAPTKITAVATLTDKKVDLNTSMILNYASGAQATLSCDDYFYAPTSYRLITREGEVTEFGKNYEGHGLREEAAEFARVVRSGAIESPLMTHETSLFMMEQMDEIRAQIGLRYPNE
jgi:predicted dehydrogenase